MRIVLLLVVIFGMDTNNFAQSNQWLWAKCTTGKSNESGWVVTSDELGNSYMSGFFESDTLIFDNDTLYGPGNLNSFTFLVKYDPNGNEVWAKSFNGGTQITSMAVKNSRLFLTAIFQSDTLKIDSLVLISNQNSDADILLGQFDLSGHVIWAKLFGDTDLNYSNSLSIDQNSNVFITGKFFGHQLQIDSTTLYNAGSANMFIAKFDSLGNNIWAFAPLNQFECGSDAVACDVDGNAYFTGYFRGQLIAQQDTLNSSNLAAFIIKISAPGNILWLKNYPGEYYESAIKVLANSIYMSCNYIGAMTTVEGHTLFNDSSTHSDCYILKLDTAGNFIWIKSVNGILDDLINDITIDSRGNLYATGFTNSSILNFDSLQLTNLNNTDNAFLVAFDSSGNSIYSSVINSQFITRSFSIACDPFDNIYITGQLYKDVYFDNIPIAFGNISNEAFIAKLSPASLGLNTINMDDFVSVYPNPTEGKLIANFPSGIKSIYISNLSGSFQKIDVEDLKSQELEFTSDGVYFCQFNSDYSKTIRKIVVLKSK